MSGERRTAAEEITARSLRELKRLEQSVTDANRSTQRNPRPGERGNENFEQWFKRRFGVTPEEATRMRTEAAPVDKPEPAKPPEDDPPNF